MKVYITPQYKHEDTSDGGVRRVVGALTQFLPEFGWDIVAQPTDADLINAHGAMGVPLIGKPVVSSCHGLYWAEYAWGSWAHQANFDVRESLMVADAITAPSEWVKRAITRGMLVNPTVIYHGVDTDEFRPLEGETDRGYILWNKLRQDSVSDPKPLMELAARMGDQRFVSTIGAESSNVKVVGIVEYEKMKALVRYASIYLATTRETMGIGTLEALASGVPVVGWDYGGQSEVIVQNETGILVEHGNFEALEQAIKSAIADRARLSQNARADAIARWGWKDKIAQYAKLFDQVMKHEDRQRKPRISVVVTSHNLGKYLPDALNSVKAQTVLDWECVVVDDQSIDNTEAVVADFVNQDPRFKYFKTPSNLKLSSARNFGVDRSTGRYIIMLDADDMLEANTLGLLGGALDKDRRITVAYGHIDLVNHLGEEQRRNDWPFEEFSWYGQMSHLNQLPYSALIRRDAFLAAGGYRARAWRAEDAELWIRLSSFGYAFKKVTQASTLIYRMRSDSKSKDEPGDGDWTAWFPWRIFGDASAAVKAGMSRLKGSDTREWADAALVPFGAQGKAPWENAFWLVPHRAEPVVSVIIPVSETHRSIVIDAIESVMAQRFPNWEIIVVNDTGSPLVVKGAPYVKIVNTAGDKGSGFARNRGAEAAKGQFICFLDADDYLLPDYLTQCLQAWNNSQRVIYTDWLGSAAKPNQEMILYEAEEFECGKILNHMQHLISVLLPKAWWLKVGGFDESMPGWEDWDFFIRLQAQGFCSQRVAQPLFVYRAPTGTRRRIAEKNTEALRFHLKTKWAPYYEGRDLMPCGRCPSPNNQSSSLIFGGQNLDQAPPDAVLVEYVGGQTQTQNFNGLSTGTRYRFGNNGGHKRKYIHKNDLEGFMQLAAAGIPIFQIVEPFTAPPPINLTPLSKPVSGTTDFPVMEVKLTRASAVVQSEIVQPSIETPTVRSNGAKLIETSDVDRMPSAESLAKIEALDDPFGPRADLVSVRSAIDSMELEALNNQLKIEQKGLKRSWVLKMMVKRLKVYATPVGA